MTATDFVFEAIKNVRNEKNWVNLKGLCMMLSLAAQEKILTMEEAIVGYHLYPQSKYIAWQGESNNFTYLSDKNLISENAATGEKRVVLTTEELNRILGTELKGFPQFSWLDEQTLAVRRQGKEFQIDAVGKRLKNTIVFPKGAANITYCAPAEAYAYTVDNNLYYVDKRGNSFAVTEDEDKNIVNGQFVSRNEFNINEGIFWAPDGKKMAFYRKDESEVTSFPLLDIESRTGTLREIKYPMAGMKSEQVSLGIYDMASQRIVFLNADDFGREQYLTNITWSPRGDAIYVQVLNRGQNHMRLNKYDASTGKLIATLFEEKSDTYVEPQDKLHFVNGSDRFIFRTNNRDGYFNLYLHDGNGKLLKRLTPVEADVEFVAMDKAGKYAYYLSSEISPVEKQLFRVDLKSGKRSRLTSAEGWHMINMSSDCSYFVDNYSSQYVPRVIDLVANNGNRCVVFDGRKSVEGL